MNWLKSLLMMFSLWTLIGCGVKGDPLPPEKPLELGRGKPTYRGATEGVKIEKVSSPAHKDRDDDDDRD